MVTFGLVHDQDGVDRAASRRARQAARVGHGDSCPHGACQPSLGRIRRIRRRVLTVARVINGSSVGFSFSRHACPARWSHQRNGVRGSSFRWLRPGRGASGASRPGPVTRPRWSCWELLMTRTLHGVAILASYPMWAGLRLHSLANATTFRCSRCGHHRESTMAATSNADSAAMLCPTCYARQLTHYA